MNDAAVFLGSMFERVLEASWQSMIIVALVLLAQWVFHRQIDAKWRFVLWFALIVRLIFIWQVPAPVSLSEGLLTTWQELATRLEMPLQTTEPVVSTTAEQAIANPPTTALVVHVDAAPGLLSLQFVAVVWLLGFLICASIIICYGIVFGRRARQAQVPLQPNVIRLFEECRQTVGNHSEIALIASKNISIPALFGAIRPCVLIPSELMLPEHKLRLRYMLLHELAHAKRHDVTFGWFLYLLLCMHWFNPILWWIARRIVADRELACDAHVLSLVSPMERHAYGHSLLDQLKTSQAIRLSPAAAGILERKTNIERRIEMLAGYKQPSRLSHCFSLGLCVALAAVAIAGTEASNDALSIDPEGITAFVAPNGGTMLATTVANIGASDIVASVAFYEGDPTKDGKKLGDGALEIPAGKSGTAAIMWVVAPGSHHIVSVVTTENTDGRQSAQRIIVCRKRNGEATFNYRTVQETASNKTSQETELRPAILDINKVLQETGFQREKLDAILKRREELQLTVDKQSDELKQEMEAARLLGERERETKGDELQQKIHEFRAQYEKWEAELDKSTAEVMGVVRARMRKEASSIAARDGYDVVINLQGHSVIWQKDEIAIDIPESATGPDITAEIVRTLKQQQS